MMKSNLHYVLLISGLGLFILFTISVVFSSADNYVPREEDLKILVLCKTQDVYFPLISKPVPKHLLIFDDSFEDEPNNTREDANGLLESGKPYSGEANDTYDLYRILLLTSGNIHLTVTGHNVPGGKVALYNATHYPTPVAYSYSIPDHVLSYPNAPESLYYITVYSPATPSVKTVYQLVVTYPVATATLTSTPINTSTPLPLCTVTPLPSHTPKLPVEEPSPTPVTNCMFEAPGTGFSVLFPTGTPGHIWADDDEEDAMITAVSLTPIAPGFYQVTMYSYDNHTVKPNQTQPAESWYLRLKNASGTVIATAGPSTDIPDDEKSNCQATYLENTLILIDTAVSAEAYHAAYPAPDKNPNSVNPDYALLIPVRMVAPPPTRTPLPPHLATPTPTP